MTPLDVLKKVTEYTERHIAPLLLMRVFKDVDDIRDNEEDFPEYVHPAVCYGSIPHKNFQQLNFQVPIIVWDCDQVDDGGDYTEGRTLTLRAYVGAYSSEIYAEDTKLPDNKAFEDLFNALEKIYIELSRKNCINGVGLRKPIQYGKYDGAYYPFAYGWLTVAAEIPRMQYDDEIDLNELFK